MKLRREGFFCLGPVSLDPFPPSANEDEDDSEDQHGDGDEVRDRGDKAVDEDFCDCDEHSRLDQWSELITHDSLLRMIAAKR